MFERFTERARQVVVLAQDEARGMKHNYIGGEHLLLGLIREEEGVGARVLYSVGIKRDLVRKEIALRVGYGDEVTTGQIPFTPRARKMLENALREALSLGHNYIGTEHLLLGMIREEEGVVAEILDSPAQRQQIRDEVIRTLSKRKPGVASAAPTKEQTTMKSDFQIQFNDDGTWRDALVNDAADENNITLYFINEVGNITGPVKANRGADAGEFRAKA